MKILGISDHLTCGAALIEDGRIVAAVNEERLARMKMVMGFPRKSIEEVLSIANVKPMNWITSPSHRKRVTFSMSMLTLIKALTELMKG